jgi:hypothetical protein
MSIDNLRRLLLTAVGSIRTNKLFALLDASKSRWLLITAITVS